jgi:6-pyruvoyltetrahydropterin/6-carboxytetrahydropterin synthase
VIALTRRYRFPAAHVLRHPALSERENRRLYGRCANPNGHGHDYGLEVTVTGPVDPRTGWILPPDRLDCVVERRILARLSHRLLNRDEWFRSCAPTAENLVLAIRKELDAALESERPARLVRVHVAETQRNQFEWGEV